ncbi:MAG: GlsB/YeaQ/YmgE family stress response membrane protein [Dactylosporangium sp.]|nr:GlsB/YeaQ/YmgE family stress response membrane protein [Dactylosporangium sp.]
MEISGIFSALIIGIVIGGLGRLVLPGRQRIGVLATLLVGVVAALVGTLVAGLFGVANTPGVDWIELGLQVGFAAVGVAILEGRRARKAITR